MLGIIEFLLEIIEFFSMTLGRNNEKNLQSHLDNISNILKN